jgi:hypothetical protein
MLPALDAVEREWRDSRRGKDAADESVGAGALILVGNRSQDKFFCNGELCVSTTSAQLTCSAGLDYANSSKDPNFFLDTYNPVMRRLLFFPRTSSSPSFPQFAH